MISALLLIAGLIAPVLTSFGNSAQIIKAKVLETDFPEVGSIDSSANYFEPYWQGDYGVKRSSDREILVSSHPAFGYRGTSRNTFDADTFGFSYDLSYVPGNVAVATILSPVQCDYLGGGAGGTAKISFDIVKNPTDANEFVVTLTAGGAHNTSIAGFGDGAWAYDGAYTGAVISASNQIVSVNLANDGANTIVTVNEKSYTVSTSVLYASYSTADHASQYFAVGMMNGSSTAYDHLIINSFGDDAEDAYYSETGAYGKIKTAIVDLEAKVADTIDTTEKLKAAKAVRETIDMSTLHSFDNDYLNPRLAAIDTAINAAVKLLGKSAVLADYEDELAKLVELDKTLTTSSQVDAAIAQIAMVNDKKAVAVTDDMMALYDDEEKTRIEAANTSFEAEIAKINNAAKTLYIAGVDAYCSKAAVAASALEISEARALRTAIPSKYSSYLTEDELSAQAKKISAADAKLEAAGHAAVEGWTIGSNAYAAKEESGMGVTLAGSSLGQESADAAGIFYGKETLKADDFSFTISREQWCNSTSAWLAFGLMEKPEIFSSADSIDCQNNKGVFFLVTYGGGQVKFELYVMSLTCNRFFDAKQTETVTIEDAKSDLTVKFTTVEKEVSGVSDTYWVPIINDQVLDGNNIKAKKIKSCLGTDVSGYFFMASQDCGTLNPFTFLLKDINGHSPYDSTLVKGASSKAPSATSTTANFEIGSGDLILPFSANGSDVTEVKLNDAILASDAYSYDSANNQITIKSAALASLRPGTATIMVSTANGSVTYTITVTAASTTSSAPATSTSSSGTTSVSSSEGGTSASGGCGGGCGGSIAGTLLASVLSLGSVIALAFCRKKKSK